MHAFLGIKFHEDLRNRDLIEAHLKNLEAAGFETTCIVRDYEEWATVHMELPDLMDATFEEIAASDLVVIDLSEKGVGLGIEAGYAAANDVPLLVVAKEGSDISGTLKGIADRVETYADPAELQDVFETYRS